MGLLQDFCLDLKNVMFPDYCPGCHDSFLTREQILCTRCMLELPFTDHFAMAENKAASHFYGRISVKACASVIYFRRFGYVQDILHSFKYEGNQKIGTAFGQIAGEKMLVSPYFRNVEAIIPVPLHSKKERWRGYNQSEIFARGIHNVYGLPLWKDVLIKNQENNSQTGMGRSERVANVSHVYQLHAKAEKIRGKHILLVDDVITTGATLEACYHTLQKASPESVSIVTLACAL